MNSFLENLNRAEHVNAFYRSTIIDSLVAIFRLAIQHLYTFMLFSWQSKNKKKYIETF